MPYPSKLRITFVITILLTSYIIADCYFRTAAFEDSNKFTISLQKKIGSSFFDAIFIIFCDILTPIVMAVLLIMYYIIFPGKLKTLSFIIYFIFIIYLTSLLKMFYNDPRPYWENSEVMAKECSTDYGNPSGHSLSAILLFGILWYRYFRYFVQKSKTLQKISQNADITNVVEQRGKNENVFFVQSKFNHNVQKEANTEIKTSMARQIQFTICSFFLLFITFLILFGRIYLGMHSYNEVLLGMLYGFYFLILYIFYFEILLMQTLEAIIKGNDQAIRNGKLLNWIYLAYLITIYVFLLVISIVTYEISVNNIKIPIIHNQNIDKYCSDRTMHKRFFYVGFIDCGIIAGSIGLLIGLLLTRGQYETLAKVYNKKLIPTNYNEHPISVNLVIKTFGRIVISFIIYGLPTVLLSIISISNIYGSFFINNNLSLLIGTIFLIKVIPFAFFKFKLETNEDLLCYRENKMIIIDDEGGDKLRIKPIYLY